MKLTEQLRIEHASIKLMLKILEKVCNKLESGEKIEPEHLASIVEFIKVFADKCHHGKEEALLFPAMEQVGIPREGGPIGIMLSDHTLGRDYVRGLSEAISKYQAGDMTAVPTIVQNARNYITLLRPHIDKEDNILFRMADIQIPEQKQKELLEQFDEVELKVIGAGKHEEFHALLKKLKQIYLG